MPLYRLGPKPAFPPPEHATPEGVLAIGGALTRDWLRAAYREGIFPWYDEPPILWWSPDPRMVLFPDEIHVARSLRSTLRKPGLEVRINTSFARVIARCASIPRRHEPGTWINPDIIRAYTHLHQTGDAHSIETWYQDQLVGGMYGISIGRVFFGESMFSDMNDASKIALLGLARHCQKHHVELIDCQVTSPHLLRMGAREIPRGDFLKIVRRARDIPGPAPFPRVDSIPAATLIDPVPQTTKPDPL